MHKYIQSTVALWHQAVNCSRQHTGRLFDALLVHDYVGPLEALNGYAFIHILCY
jgi:hypothetical protein